MCIIAIQPNGTNIPKNILRNCWDSNNDGAGIMYCDNGKIIVHRELTSFNKFFELKRNADKLNTNIVMHFRIATSGGINNNNIHPFKVNDNLYFCHNGILDIDVPNGSPINDTQIYSNAFLKGMPNDFHLNHSIMNLIEYSIGNRNKFVFLDSNGEFHILNESAGIWHNGAWYSNSSFQSYSNYGYSYNYNKSNFEWIECECCNEKKNENELSWNREFDMTICNSCAAFIEMDEKI